MVKGSSVAGSHGYDPIAAECHSLHLPRRGLCQVRSVEADTILTERAFNPPSDTDRFQLRIGDRRLRRSRRVAAGTPASNEAATDDRTVLKAESTKKPFGLFANGQVVDVVVDPQSLERMSSMN